MKKFLFLPVTCFIAGFAYTQENQFLVYSFRGNVSVMENKVERKVKVGNLLGNTATLKIANGSVATLICNGAAMFVLTKGGAYPVSKLSDSCNITTRSVSANYVKYVWTQMTTSHGAPGTNRKAYMNTVGAVSRAINNIWIDPRLDTVNYSQGAFPLSWKSYTDAKEFEFVLFSNDNIMEPVFKTTVSTPKISLEQFITKITPGTYYWSASVKGEANEELKVFNYVNTSVFEQLSTTIKNQGVPFETDAEKYYRTAFMLEDEHYLAEAYQYYSKAAALDTINTLYRATLMSFKKDYEIK